MLISPTSEKVSPPGTDFLQAKKKLNCYKLKNASVCVQLNCYTGHDDSVFRDHLREFEAKMSACEPEPEDQPGSPAETSPAAAAAGAPAQPGAEAGAAGAKAGPAGAKAAKPAK